MTEKEKKKKVQVGCFTERPCIIERGTNLTPGGSTSVLLRPYSGANPDPRDVLAVISS